MTVLKADTCVYLCYIRVNFYYLNICHCGEIINDITNDSLAPGRFELNFRWVISVLNLVIDGWCVSAKVALK